MRFVADDGGVAVQRVAEACMRDETKESSREQSRSLICVEHYHMP